LNFNGADALTVTTSDNGHTGSDPGLTGGPADERDQDLLTINVALVNDAPSAMRPQRRDPRFRIAHRDYAQRLGCRRGRLELPPSPRSPEHGQLFAAPAGGSAVAVKSGHRGIPGTARRSISSRPRTTNGPDSFTYTAFDGALGSAAATASITVTAVADIVDDNITVNENASGQNLLCWRTTRSRSGPCDHGDHATPAWYGGHQQQREPVT